MAFAPMSLPHVFSLHLSPVFLPHVSFLYLSRTCLPHVSPGLKPQSPFSYKDPSDWIENPPSTQDGLTLRALTYLYLLGPYSK